VNTPLAESRVEELLADPAASHWLKQALQTSLKRDPVDALNDSLALAGILEERLRRAFELDDRA
jgi:hypothetical protein